VAAILNKGYPQGVCLDCLVFASFAGGDGCLIGKVLKKAAWDAIAESDIGEAARTIEILEALVEEGESLEDEVLTLSSSESTSLTLVEDEVVHHESTVYLSEATFASALREEAQLLLTSRRIVIVHYSAMLDIRLADVESVEMEFPGFVVRARNVRFPLYFQAAPGDPVFHAIVGALKKIQ
jgi:hypothetical protein